MESKQLWTIIGVSAVVAVLSSLITLGVVIGPSLSPQLAVYKGDKLTEAQAQYVGVVNAHKCQADGVCETNSVKVGNHMLESINYLGQDTLATDGFLAEEFVASEAGAFEENLIVGFSENSTRGDVEIIDGSIRIGEHILRSWNYLGTDFLTTAVFLAEEALVSEKGFFEEDVTVGAFEENPDSFVRLNSDGSIILTDSIYFQGFAGQNGSTNGTFSPSYACLSPGGRIYPSHTPCV